ncbi:MAG: transposase [Prochlorococcaceae cyanobacterium]
MKRTRHTAEPIIRKLNTAEQLIAQGKTVVDVCRVLEVTQPTYHRWRQQYGGMQAEEARRLTQLEKAMLKDLAEGTFRTQNSAGGPSGFCRSVTGHQNPEQHLGLEEAAQILSCLADWARSTAMATMPGPPWLRIVGPSFSLFSSNYRHDRATVALRLANET